MKDLSGREWLVGHCRDCGRELKLYPNNFEADMVVYRQDGLEVYCWSCTRRMFPPMAEEQRCHV